ncbi:hypothetical protein STEG23_034714, partial [Scotinomys teguina]
VEISIVSMNIESPLSLANRDPLAFVCHPRRMVRRALDPHRTVRVRGLNIHAYRRSRMLSASCFSS